MLPQRLRGIPSAFAPANTPSQSHARDAGQCSIHCKSIHALSVTKRGLPAPPPSSHVGVAAEYDAAREDDEFYTTHARTYIAVVPSLSPSFPSSAASTAAAAWKAAHRVSLVLPAPYRAFVRLSRACAADRHLIRGRKHNCARTAPHCGPPSPGMRAAATIATFTLLRPRAPRLPHLIH
ncbi:hypothetical protein C8R44DRAFT_896278 [Mycena epipterygia]|nr:hypothetical protein C8R44DRAFT_896278 [Mycena epipterygia]